MRTSVPSFVNGISFCHFSQSSLYMCLSLNLPKPQASLLCTITKNRSFHPKNLCNSCSKTLKSRCRVHNYDCNRPQISTKLRILVHNNVLAVNPATSMTFMNVKKVNYWFQFIATRSKHFGRLQVPKTLHLHPSMTKRQVQRSENTCKDVSPDRPRCPPSIEALNCTIRHKNLRVTLIVWGIRRFDLGVAQGLMGQWKTMHSFPKNSPHLWLKNCSQLQCTSFNLCNITWPVIATD